MIFLNFSTELVNLSQIYQIDLKDSEDGNGVVIAFFYHLAGSTSGGYKVSEKFETVNEAVRALISLGIEIKTVIPAEGYYDASRVPTGRVNARVEPTRKQK